MRRAHTIFVTADGKCEILFDYRTHHAEQKKKIKELMHQGFSIGGVIEFSTSDGDVFKYKVPAAIPEPLPEPASKSSRKIRESLAIKP